MPVPADITVILADRPGVARDALALVLSGTPGLALVAEVATADELRAAVTDARPDVVVIDDRLMGHGALTPGGLGTRVVVVGVDDDPAYTTRARRIGAEAWVPKEHADWVLPDVLLRAAPVPAAA